MRWLGVFLSVAALVTSAAAEPEGGSASTEQDALEQAAAAESVKLTPKEKRVNSERMIAEMRAALTRVTDLLGDARTEKDVVMLNCVNKELQQIKGLLAISEAASVAMLEKLADPDPDVQLEANLDYTKIAVAHQKVLICASVADKCAGTSTVYTGETAVKVEVEDKGGKKDPTKNDGLPSAPATPSTASGS